MPIIKCPHCKATVEIDSEHLGMDVECGQCHQVFKAEVAAPSAPPKAKSTRDWGDREHRSDDDDDDDDDYEDRPRRRRRRRGFEPDERTYSDAVEAARGPGNGLIAVGWFGLVIYLLAGIGLFVAGIYMMGEAGNQNNRNRIDDGIPLMIMGAILAIFGSVYSAVIAIGGHRLKALKSFAFPMTSGIMGILTVIFCHPFNPITWASLGIGIWALVVVNRNDVKWAIEHNQRREY